MHRLNARVVYDEDKPGQDEQEDAGHGTEEDIREEKRSEKR
jgi:hypothetical protein